MSLKSRLTSYALFATILGAGVSGDLVAQASFSKGEKPFSTISRMFIKAPARDSLVQLTREQVGLRYRYGAKAPGAAFDCSGLVQWVMARFDVVVPRTSREQAKVGFPVAKDTAQLLPGDLLYFGRGRAVDHVGIYIGNGRYVHAANRRKGVIEAPLPTGRWATTWWKGARRLFALEGDTPVVSSDSLTLGQIIS